MRKFKKKKNNNIFESWKRLVFDLECDIQKQKKTKKYFNVCVLEVLLFFISLPLHFYVTPKAMPEYVKTIKGRKAKTSKEVFCDCYNKRQRINYKILLIVAFFISLKILLGSIYIITKPVFLNAAIEDNTWDFSIAGDYTYDNTKIDVVGGVANLKYTDINILDDTQVEFDNGIYNDTQFNTDHIELNLYEIIQDSNTLALYHFNKTSGTIEDSSGNNNDAVNNGATQGIIGKVYNAISFDGSDDYLNIPGDLGDPSEMTVSFWFNKSNINSGTDYIIDARDNGNWRMLQDSTAGACSDSSGNICFNGRVEIPSSMLSNNTWYHVTATASSIETKIYLNGNLIDTGTGFDPSLGTDIRIGRRYNGGNYYEGALDELAIWDTVLTSSEIKKNAQNLYKSSGEYESNIFDAGDAVPWNEISWAEELKAGDWYNSSWLKRRKLTVDNTLNSNTLTNYQVRLKINYSPDMKSDFSDLRFTDSDGITLLDYWVQNYVSATNATIWVEVPLISTSSETQLFMYYGNSGATSDSNGENTFLFFDDFEDGSIDGAKWSEIDIPADEISESNGKLNFARTTNGGWNKAVIANTSFARDDYSFEFNYEWTINNPSYDAIMFGWHDNGSGASYTNLIYGFYNNGAGVAATVNSNVYEDGSNRAGVSGTWTVNKDYDVRLRMKSGGGAYYEQSTDSGDSWTVNYDSTYSIEGNAKPAWSFYSGTHEFDNARVRQWTAPEPIIIIGSEQSEIQSDIQFQVRSCDDALCDTELFTGPDGTGATYYTASSGEALNVIQNQYFQYKAFLSTQSADTTTSKLYSINIDSRKYNTDSPEIMPSVNFILPEVTKWDTFSENATKTGGGQVYYQLSDDNGSNWYYWDGANWVNPVGPTDYNTASVVNNNFDQFSSANNQIKFKAFLVSDGSGQVNLDSIQITYLTEINTIIDVKDWHFDVPGDYTYDSAVIDVTGSNALLKQSSGSFTDVLEADFNGVYNQTEYITDHIELKSGKELTVNAGTQALYHFNEGSLTDVGDETGNFDGIGSNITWTTGKFGTSALGFNGTDSVVLPSAGISQGLLDGHTAHTIEAWVKRNTNSNRQAIFIEGGTTYGFGLYLDDGTGDINHYIRSSGSTTDEVTYPVSNLIPGIWYHLAGVWDGGTGELSLYVNGVNVSTKTTSINNLPNPGNGWRIGGTTSQTDIIDGSSSINLDGELEELKIYNTALDSTAINNDYAAFAIGDYVSEVNNAGEVVAYNTISWTEVLPTQTENKALQIESGVASASDTFAGNPVILINDGNSGVTFNGWANNNIADSRLMIKLNTPQTVSKIKLYFGGDGTSGLTGQNLPKSYRVQVTTDNTALVTDSINDPKWTTLNSADSLTTDQGTVSLDSVVTGFTMSDYNKLVTHTFDSKDNVIAVRIHFNDTAVGGTDFIGQIGEFEVYADYSADIKFQVRSCDDALCDTETFIGPNGTNLTYYSVSSGEALNVNNNQYFQYKAFLDTFQKGLTPELSNLMIDASGPYSITNPDVYPNNSLNVTGLIEWRDFQEVATKPAGSELYYQLSDDNGISWDWYNGTSWANTSDGEPADGATELLYHFTETSGSIIDSSSNNIDGVNYGASLGVTGGHGNGIQFDGIDDYVEVPYDAVLNLSGDFTLEFWIKTSDSDGFLFKKYSGLLGGDAWAVDISGGYLRFYDGTSWINTDVKIDDNTLHYVAIVGDSGANTFETYLDNVLQTTKSYTAIPNNLFPLIIGKKVSDTYFDGILDEIRISNVKRSLTDMRIAQYLYNTGALLQSNILNYPTLTNDILFKAFLLSDGTVTPSLDNVRVEYKYALNNLPSASAISSIMQSTDGLGLVSFETTVTDSDNETTRMIVEYSDDNGLNWYDAYLDSVTVSNGSVDVNNSNAYQIGTGNPIDTDSGSVTLTIVWDTLSSSNGNGSLDNSENSNIQVRVRPHDGTNSGNWQTSASFSIDNLDPAGFGTLAINTITINSFDLSWTSASVETDFNTYEFWYGDSQFDVENQTGTAVKWDKSNDVNLANMSANTTTITGLNSSTTYYVHGRAADDFGNVLSSNTVFNTTLTAPSGGGGGGGGSGSTYISSPVTVVAESVGDGDTTISLFNIEEFNIGELKESGTNIISTQKKTAKFDLFGTKQLYVNTIDNKDVEFLLPSGEVYTLEKYQKIQIDLDEDNCNDFEVRLNDLFTGTADLTIKKIVGKKIEGLQPNSLIKVSDLDTVYYYGKDCRRHVFPDRKTYDTWYINFDNVNEVSLDTLSKIPFGENVTYRPGINMLKIETDPKVYAVYRSGVLRWVKDEVLAKALYGLMWNTLIYDLPDSFFVDYVIGDNIESSDQYDPLQEILGSQTININKGYSFVGTEVGANTSLEKELIIDDDDGLPKEETLIINNTDCSTDIQFTAFLGIGVVNDQVGSLQELLKCLGYFPLEQDSTSQFGSITEQAVKDFQKANGIEQAGYVGPSTRSALNKYSK